MSVLTAPPRRHHVAPLAFENEAVQVTSIVGALLEGVALVVITFVDDAAVVARRLRGADNLWLFGLNWLRLDRNNRLGLWLFLFGETDGNEEVSPPVSKELLAWSSLLLTNLESFFILYLGRTKNGDQSYKCKLLHDSLFVFSVLIC